jgi:aspartate kinase
MALVVQKFGGTSVANISRIESTAKIIKKELELGNKVVVVVSAMAGVTDTLVKLSTNVSGDLIDQKQRREQDAILASGEAVSAGLMALSLQKIGVDSMSMQSWQVPIYSTSDFSFAKITSVIDEKIFEIIDAGAVPVICGFQGVHDDSITTLGRGGSDTTAVAIAASIKAERCDIYTDVDGIYTCDPNLIPFAKKIDVISYDEIITMAHSGAKVLHPRAAQIGKKYNMKMRVLSSLSPDPKGTTIVNNNDYLEKPMITGIAQLKNISLINMSANLSVVDVMSHAKGIEFLIESTEHSKTANKFCISLHDKDVAAFNALNMHETIEHISGLNKISIVGYGIKNDNEIVEKVFKIFNLHRVSLERSVVQDIVIHLFVKGDTTELMLNLHKELIE